MDIVSGVSRGISKLHSGSSEVSGHVAAALVPKQRATDVMIQ